MTKPYLSYIIKDLHWNNEVVDIDWYRRTLGHMWIDWSDVDYDCIKRTELLNLMFKTFIKKKVSPHVTLDASNFQRIMCIIIESIMFSGINWKDTRSSNQLYKEQLQAINFVRYLEFRDITTLVIELNSDYDSVGSAGEDDNIDVNTDDQADDEVNMEQDEVNMVENNDVNTSGQENEVNMDQNEVNVDAKDSVLMVQWQKQLYKLTGLVNQYGKMVAKDAKLQEVERSNLYFEHIFEDSFGGPLGVTQIFAAVAVDLFMS